MTTAVVAGLLQYFGRVDLPLHGGTKKDVEADLEIIHSVAQVAHCVAQGKIGSGFDVSCAVYGSQRYVRFSPSVLSSAQVLSLNCYYLWLISLSPSHTFSSVRPVQKVLKSSSYICRLVAS